jgi:hypothetical protein
LLLGLAETLFFLVIDHLFELVIAGSCLAESFVHLGHGVFMLGLEMLLDLVQLMLELGLECQESVIYSLAF